MVIVHCYISLLEGRWFYIFHCMYYSIHVYYTYNLSTWNPLMTLVLIGISTLFCRVNFSTKIEDIHGLQVLYIYTLNRNWLIPHYHIVIPWIQNCIMSQTHQITAKKPHTHKKKNIYIYNNLLKIPSSRLCQPSSQEWFKGVVARTAPFGAFVTVTLEGGRTGGWTGACVQDQGAADPKPETTWKKGGGVAIFFGVHPKNNKKIGETKGKGKKLHESCWMKRIGYFFWQEQVPRSRCWKRVGCEGCLSGLVVRGVRIVFFLSTTFYIDIRAMKIEIWYTHIYIYIYVYIYIYMFIFCNDFLFTSWHLKCTSPHHIWPCLTFRLSESFQDGFVDNVDDEVSVGQDPNLQYLAWLESPAY